MGGRRLKRVAWLTAAAASALGPAVARAQTPIPIRFAVIGSSGQSEVPYAIQRHGLDRAHGLALEVVDFAAPGQQYMLYRSDSIDVSAGNFVDLLRQRKSGVALQAFHGFQRYDNRIVTKPASAIRRFGDLRGKRVGEFGATFLDWLVIRAAGTRAFGLDLERDAMLVQGSPPLLNQFLDRDELDATLQFSTLTFEPVAHGRQRVVTDLPGLMRAAGFNTDCFYVQWHVAEKWTNAHPGAVARLDAMVADAYAALRRDDALWPVLGERVRITDPAIVAAYRSDARRIDDPPYRRDLLAPTQRLLDALVAVAGDAVGVTVLDPAAYLFPRGRG
jgi:NitT/TauT family transport system substrate-binding protein